MIGLDTNVLVRYATQDDRLQAALAERVISSLTADRPGFVSQIALVECVWVLRRLFEGDDESISTFVTYLLDAREIVVEHSDRVRTALSATRGGAEFTDALLALAGTAAGCDHTVTFDRRAARVGGMRLVTSR
ncbi:PIN domain-containing protein [soil metagenome]